MFIQPIPMWWGSNDNWAYLVVDDESRDALIIDPANPEEVIPVLIAAIQSNKLNLVAVINTHHHWDHAGGNEEILAALGNPKLDIIGGKDCEGVTKTPGHGETFKLGNITITSIHTPCHTQDSICFFFQDGDQKAVFTGDTLFTGGCGRFFEGTAEEMHVALNKHLASLPDDTVVFPGHEYTRSNAKFAISVLQSKPVQQLLSFSDANHVTVGKYTIGHEKQHNVFMRLDVSPHISNVENSALTKEDPDIQRATGETDPVSVMEKLREMKNEYKEPEPKL